MLLSLLFASATLIPLGQDGELIDWGELPALPDSIGRAGAFVGTSGGALVVAGGANFPAGRPWDGHPKVWHRDAFVLTTPDAEWLHFQAVLPEQLAYGVTLQRGDEMIIAGGGNASRHTDAVAELTWTGRELQYTELGHLPGPTSFACGAVVGDVAVVFGGMSAPDSARPHGELYWSDLARGEWSSFQSDALLPRQLAIAGSHGDHFFVFSGVDLENRDGNPSARVFLKDAWKIDIGLKRRSSELAWEQLTDCPRPMAAAPSPAIPLGVEHLVMFGGDDGAHYGEDLRDTHPGFAATGFAYDVVLDRWRSAGSIPSDPSRDPIEAPSMNAWSPVTTGAVLWNDSLVIASGEARPGVRTPRVLYGTQAQQASSFGALNWTILCLYLLLLVALGVYIARRNRSADDFFLAGGRIPWWAAGLSIFGTQLSAITFLAVPAKTFAGDWTHLLLNFGILAVAPIVIVFYLPHLRRPGVTSAYEFLERRFSPGLRLFGALSFTLFQLARMGIVLLLPALALSAVTGIDIYLCILAMGVLSTAYTVLGGIEAVIWTDVIQVVVLLGGALAAIVIITFGIDGGFTSIFELANAQDKLRLIDLDWSLASDGVLVLIFGSIFANLIPYTSDQAVVQRYLTTPDDASARKAIWTNAFLSLPASALFFFLGTALFAWYSQMPERLGVLAKQDQILPWFVANEMPAGLAGLVIAGVFAAAMSSLDSSMHSIATVTTKDIFKISAEQSEDALRIARRTTLFLGVLGTATAALLASFEIRSLWTAFLQVIGLCLGALGGLFALAVFSKRADARHAWIGTIASVAAIYAATQTDRLHGLLLSAIGVITCLVVGSLAALLLPRSTRS
jgi:SSS family solute:Na+ symporter